jgi:A/G-specific adenine glycosylase
MGIVRHGFTHFELEIEVYATGVAVHPKLAGQEARWVSELGAVALPTVMRKIVEHALKDEAAPRRRAI